MKNEALDLIKFDGYEKQSLFYGRISKNLRKLSKRIERKRVKYIEKKKCAYQPAWDWKKETVVFSRLLLALIERKTENVDFEYERGQNHKI